MFKLFVLKIETVFRRIFKTKKSPYHTIYMEELPDKLEKRVIYILGEGCYLWSAAMLCPCGCGHTLHMSLHEEGHPRWKLTRHKDGTVSLTPSIWRKNGCRSHFFFEHGCIKWCRNNESGK